MMIFVPATRAQLEAWRAGDRAVGVPAFAATSAMIAAHGYGTQETEDADFAALLYAGIASLRTGPRRWVAAAEVARVDDRRSTTGEIGVPTLRWADVQALFTDETEALADVARLATAVADRTLDEVLVDEAVLDAAQEHDLLWYAPDELDRIA